MSGNRRPGAPARRKMSRTCFLTCCERPAPLCQGKCTGLALCGECARSSITRMSTAHDDTLLEPFGMWKPLDHRADDPTIFVVRTSWGFDCEARLIFNVAPSLHNTCREKPPASKALIDRLPTTEITLEEVGMSSDRFHPLHASARACCPNMAELIQCQQLG